MEKEVEIYIQLAFELGQAYQNIYKQIGLDNVVDFNDIAFANRCGARWTLKGDMSDLPKLFEVHKLTQDGINELNKIAKELQKVKKIASERLKVNNFKKEEL